MTPTSRHSLTLRPDSFLSSFGQSFDRITGSRAAFLLHFTSPADTMKFSTTVGMGLAFAPLSLATYGRSNVLSPRNNYHPRSGSLEGRSTGGNTVIVIPNKGSASNRQGNNNNAMGGVSPINSQNGAQGSAGSQVFMVNVGGPGGLVFEPQQIKGAKVGDRVHFMMMSKNHSVTESTFEKPCEIKQGGQNSGFLPNPNNTSPPPTFMFEVKDTKPVCKYPTKRWGEPSADAL